MTFLKNHPTIRSITALLAILVLLLQLTACGGTEEGNSSSDTLQIVSDETVGPQSAPSNTESAAATSSKKSKASSSKKSATVSHAATTSTTSRPASNAATTPETPVTIEDNKPVVEGEKIEVLPPAPAVYNSVSEEDYHFADQLGGKLKQAYLRLKNAVATRSVGMIELGNLTEEEARLVFMAVRNDYPEYFWIPNRYYIQFGGGTLKLGMESSQATDISYLCTEAERKAMSAALSTQLQAISSEIQRRSSGGKLSDFELELLIHDWICEKVIYDTAAAADPDSNPMAFTAYGALVEGKAVCEGYARAAQLLLNYFGIPTTLITGTDHTGSGHMWNLVKVGGNWYHLDITWDDCEENQYYHFYFNLPDTVLRRDHTIDPQTTTDALPSNRSYNYKIPTCSNEAENYAVHYGVSLNNVSSAKETVKAAMIAAIQNRGSATEVRVEFGISASLSATQANKMYRQLLNGNVLSECLYECNLALINDIVQIDNCSYLCGGDGSNGGFTVICHLVNR